MKHYDVGIFGLWYGNNYGSIITYYALSKVIEELGLTYAMIRNPLGREIDIDSLERSHPLRFAKEKYQVTQLRPLSRLGELNQFFDTFLIGSDQMWNYHLSRSYKQSYFLDFANDDKKKIAYATSFGKDTYIGPDEEKPVTRKNLQRFHSISVRDDFSKRICENDFGVHAEVLLDPVFLCPVQKYDELIAEASDFHIDSEYIFAYILDPNPKIGQSLSQIAKQSGQKIVIVSDQGFYSRHRQPSDREKLQSALNLSGEEFCFVYDPTVQEWLNCFKNAEFVVTDSFHGACFSIVFKKPFIVMKNKMRGATRFPFLLERFDLLDRMVESPEAIYEKFKETGIAPAIHYDKVYNVIDSENEKATKWLKNALETPIDKMPSIVLPESEEIQKKRTEEQKAMQAETERLHKNEDFIKIRILATLLRDYGVKHVVLSPGGRDVPLVRMFEYNEKHFILHRITDERSAAYFAMGIAAQTKTPVACVCTSGTAASNFLPAITEAFYTHVPLIAITADRYTVYHEQGEDQTIPQSHIYDGVIKKSVTLPEGTGYRAEYQTRRDISECILETTHHVPGPVHINVAIGNVTQGAKAPVSAWSLLPKIYPHILRAGWDDGEKKLLEWVTALKRSQRILVVYGQNPPPTEEQKKYIEEFAKKYNCVIITDPISNLHCAYSMQPHNMLSAINQGQFNKELSPDILITVGGKRLMNDPLTAKIRGGSGGIRNWHVTPDGKVKDFYFRLTSVIEMSQESFFQWFSEHAGNSLNNGVYYGQWLTLNQKYQANAPVNFNADYILSESLPKLPEGSLLHLGVGVTFYNCRKYSIPPSVEVYCNMGTNGIDGCTSTFMGQCSVVKDRLCFLIVGDLSFFYDMNSIWNKHPANNVRILMINNNGTGLLRGHRLKGISSVHGTSAKGWVESTGFTYLCARGKEDFAKQLATFLDPNADAPLFLEVFCE